MSRTFLLIGLLAMTGCGGPKLVGQFTLISTRQVVAADPLVTHHSRRWCSKEDRIPSTRAVRLALEDVPDANVMTDVSLTVEQVGRTLCAIAAGTLGRIR